MDDVRSLNNENEFRHDMPFSVRFSSRYQISFPSPSFHSICYGHFYSGDVRFIRIAKAQNFVTDNVIKKVFK